MIRKIITLTTDFGLRDPYVAEMKAVILGICPEAIIIDVTHEITKFNIRMGAYVLASAATYFAQGTIHVSVVDPGVGTRRRPLLIHTQQGFLVGPDNGILVLAAEKQGIRSIHEITSSKLMLPNVSNTFHGRDVFAPAAAHLANNTPPSDFGPEIHQLVKPEFTKVDHTNGELEGEVLHIDGFGNIITNINGHELTPLSAGDCIWAGTPSGKARLKSVNTYSEIKPQEAGILVGSQGFVEIAINQGNASEKFKVKPGDKIALFKCKRMM